MDAQPPVFSGTLKVHACHVLWPKTPVQLTYHRQDYRHALPVLLIRRPGLLGGEFRVPLDPCIHPVRLLPVSRKMAAKLEFALEYGWHTRQVRLRAPDGSTYRQWTSLVLAALESGRRPLASCTSTTIGPTQDLECSSLASTLNSSNNSSNARFTTTTIRRRVPQEEEERHPFDHRGPMPSDFFVLREGDSHPDPLHVIQDDFNRPSWAPRFAQQRSHWKLQLPRSPPMSVAGTPHPRRLGRRHPRALPANQNLVHAAVSESQLVQAGAATSVAISG